MLASLLLAVAIKLHLHHVPKPVPFIYQGDRIIGTERPHLTEPVLVIDEPSR